MTESELPAEGDLDPGSPVAGTRDDRQLVDVGAVKLGVGQATGDRLDRQRKAGFDVPAHPLLGSREAEILDAGIDDRVALLDSAVVPDPARGRVTPVVLREEAAPELSLRIGRRKGRPDADDSRAAPRRARRRLARLAGVPHDRGKVDGHFSRLPVHCRRKTHALQVGTLDAYPLVDGGD